MVSSYFYLYLGAFRDITHEEGFHELEVVSDSLEAFFLIYIILQFFKEYSNVDGGDHEKPVRVWTSIIIHYLTGDFIMDLIPILPL